MKTIDTYKNEILKLYNGEYIILSNEYKGDKIKLLTKHSICNQEFEISPNRLLSGNGCKKCAYKKKSEEMKLKCINKEKQFKTKSPEDFRKEFYNKFNSLELLNDYTNSKAKIKVKCNKCDYIWDIIPNKLFNNKNTCPNCYRILKRKHNQDIHLLEKYLNKLSNNDKYKVLSLNNDLVKLKHENCNCVWDTTIYELNKDTFRKCVVCNDKNNISNTIALKYLIKGFLIGKQVKFEENYIENNFNVDFKINNILIKIINIKTDNVKFKDKNILFNTFNYFKNNNYRLITIYSDELENKTDIVLSKISHILNLNNNLSKIYARNCYVKEINRKDKNYFLDKNHIQGSDKSNIHLGLYYEDKLVSVMTYVKPRKSLGIDNSTSEYDYELSRFASLNDHIIVGAFSKLFEYFKRNYEWNKIITYADLRYSVGNLYKINNFKISHYSKPSHYYVNLSSNNIKREFRFKYRKQMLKQIFPESYDDNKSEKEIMEENNFYHLYNLGNIAFVYSKE